MNEQPLVDVAREKIISLAAETQFAPNGIVSRTVLRTANARVVLFGFSEGAHFNTTRDHSNSVGGMRVLACWQPALRESRRHDLHATKPAPRGQSHQAILDAADADEA